MAYKKIFDPDSMVQSFDKAKVAKASVQMGDRRDGLVYVYTEKIILAVNVAIATGRPLLIRGPSGSGKSSLAQNVALGMGWRYYEAVISSRTQARDLLWKFDTLRRLSDAQAKRLKDEAFYIEPGVLWWAFARNSAKTRGQKGNSKIVPAVDPAGDVDHEQAVVLLDEIDKADPDTPNNLLVALGSLQFIVQEIGIEVKAKQPPLIIITTNDERELPSAFLRRCVILVLEHPNGSRLVDIAKAHFGSRRSKLYRKIASIVKSSREQEKSTKMVPSTAEYLDTVRTCIDLGVSPNSKVWEEISRFTMWKQVGPLEYSS